MGAISGMEVSTLMKEREENESKENKAVNRNA